MYVLSRCFSNHQRKIWRMRPWAKCKYKHSLNIPSRVMLHMCMYTCVHQCMSMTIHILYSMTICYSMLQYNTVWYDTQCSGAWLYPHVYISSVSVLWPYTTIHTSRSNCVHYCIYKHWLGGQGINGPIRIYIYIYIYINTALTCMHTLLSVAWV